ncbi:MAG TPA: ATP-dependent helicase HrpB [Xanthobacteraceae bacterium]|jgi:ATP-dependent helicase HrpB
MQLGGPLPIDAVLPELTGALTAHNAAVLVAPPGAGKTTRVPLVLAAQRWAQGKKIIVLEPRRIAARAAAARMAATLGETVGATVGYRVRFGSRISEATRVEVVTEGVFTRLVLERPTLEDVAAIIFDEFHERSLDGDLGLALARDAQQGLREDLKLLVMSATLEGTRIAGLLAGAPVVESAGRSFPVETRYLGRDVRIGIEREVAQAVLRALRSEAGSLLVFLPGIAEIHRTQALLRECISEPGVDIVALHGALEAQVQDRAIAPAPAGRRKIVLATSVAETSLTIEGVRVVVDSGLARVPRYEPDLGLTHLRTVRVSRASADQRRGRAGRTEPGVCYRLWDEPQTSALEAANRPEILAADLSGFLLDLAHWGIADPSMLAFVDAPPAPALAEAKRLLIELDAIDGDWRITEAGRGLRRLPLPPRLARMVLRGASMNAAELATEIALILTEPGLGGKEIELAERLEGLRQDQSERSRAGRAIARRWARLARSLSPFPPGSAAMMAGKQEALSPGALVALAYPDRIARNRGEGGTFLLANGRGARVSETSGLARTPFLAIAHVTGSAAQGRIQLAAPISQAEIETFLRDRIESRKEIGFDQATESLRARQLRVLGAVVLSEQLLQVIPSEENARLLAEATARLGIDRLPWTNSLRQWRDRVMFLRRIEGQEWPDVSDEALARNAGEWLAAAFSGKTALAELRADELTHAVQSLLPWALRGRLEAQSPTHFRVPSGSSVPIDYATQEGPKISARVQELFGLDRHPAIAGGRIPLLVELLSPARRPVQITRDLPGFWRGSYGAVRAEMRGRYPRHPWPEDPLTASATAGAKPRPR